METKKKEKGNSMFCFLLGMILLSMLWIGQASVVRAAGRIEGSIRSQGRLSYTDAATGETVLVDSADFYYLAKQLDDLNALVGR